MKNPTILALFAVVMTLGVSCGDAADKTEGESTTEVAPAEKVADYTLTYETHSARENDCTGEDCTEIEVMIPRVDGKDSSVADDINEAVEGKYRELVKSRLPEPIGNASWEVMTDKFIEGYELFLMEFPDSPAKWFLRVNGEKSSIEDGIFTLQISDSEYMGGAHPNSYTFLQSFDLATGDRIMITDRFDEIRLREIAERKFREQHGLSPDAPLDDGGFMFPGGRFILPENMALVGDEILLIYNPYEVAAYAEGETVLRIPVSEVRKREAV